MPPRSISPASTADQNAEHKREEPEPARAATPPAPPPPPKGHLRHTGQHPSPHGCRAVLPVHPTRPPGGPRDPPGVQAGEQERQRVGHGGRPSLGRHLERHQGRLPGSSSRNLPPPARGHQARPPRPPSVPQLETPPHHHPPPPPPQSHQWTPEDDATAAITVQQSPENPEEYHITWNDPAPHPPASLTLPDVFGPSAQNCRRRKPHNNQTKRCPRHHPHQPHKKAPAQSPSPTTSPQWSSPHSTAPPRTATGFGTCHGNGRSTTTHSDGTKSHRGSRPSASTRSPSPPPPGHYRRATTTSS